MISTATRLIRLLLWLTVTALVILAIAVTAMRIALPQLNHFQPQIQSWINQGTGLEFEVAEIKGFWRNTHPSLSLQQVKAKTPASSGIHFSADKVEVELDLIQSLLQQQPVVADLNIYQLNLDISSVEWINTGSDETPKLQPQGDQKDVMQQLDQLLLRQLDGFSLAESKIHFLGIDGTNRELDIKKLRWQNNGRHHLADGEVSLAHSNLNSAQVKANFIDHGSLKEVSGEFYLSVQNVLITPWLTKFIKTESGIDKGQISFSSWLTLKHSQPTSAYLEFDSSELSWQEGQQHELWLDSGVVELEPYKNGWQVNAHSLSFTTDETKWPDLDIAFDWQPDEWRLNVSQLDIAAITPLVKLAPNSKPTTDFLKTLAIGGSIEDVRVSMGDDLESLKYSAQLSSASMTQWELLPGLNHLSASVSGDLQQAKAKVTLIDDVLPYADVFQAPLNIKQGQVDIVWQNSESGWSLWADKVTAATPDLQVLGAFKLDFPIDKSPFLSFYAEADLYNAAETWRYLPTLALGRDLTDYLSTAIQGGKVNTAKLLWYGELGDFPYHNNDGMFQAWVGLKQAKFSFDTAWPPITDLQLDLLFQNDAMHLDSRSATLMDVKAKRITGRIPELAEGGHIEIEAQAVAQGNAVRDYMTASPLVDSVGAALTAVQVDGRVESSFQLNIPFSEDKEARAWGYADLKDNHVTIDAPPMTLEKVSGRVEFDNDVVSAAGLSAGLLNQPVSIDFQGENIDQGYGVAIDVVGDWEVEPLVPYLGKQWLEPLNGHAPWSMDVDIQLNDVGFTYQINTEADLKYLASDFPTPLSKSVGVSGKARLEASGNQESITARVQLPNFKYQTEIDIRPDVPVLTDTYLLLGKGSFKISPVAGHQAKVVVDDLDLDQWFERFAVEEGPSEALVAQMNTPQIPLPTRVDLDAKELTLGTIDWNDVDFSAKRKGLGWYMSLDSQEAKGEASYIEPYDLSVSLERLHVYIPALDKEYKDKGMFEPENNDAPLISHFERTFHEQIPNITLAINDFWLQGYKVGKTHLDLQRQGEKLEWKKLTFESGANKVDMKGWWRMNETESHTKFDVEMSGENNSDVMERFGITSGIQRAPFEISTQLEWDGSPWSGKVDTLNGEVSTKLGKGMISDVSGAARLLGIFSLDSIIRKMQLDFSDVFDKGMAFNSITGSGSIRNGIFLTNDIKMDAVAGEMNIKGLANLNSRTVDAEVKFTPDITSGIPVLTAFAVTPQTALYVLAITTVISPVVEVFTQVNYEVKGPLDSPVVKELSRSKGEFKLPESLRESTK
ncbi:TIGR02099 family protein [Vibrio tubiashii]|uniref:YhdP family protein n=1 Tax=Vibrio tubiashii TaxID=29498 RepID=UPI001EFD48FF|nr:TIGR02099 family protein [Vibrio tubiashii]MCG9617990.1 TIGR02099 family protein [Vibrio tubiashii]MCG9685789.1 TIGR02099 family protein [Vibrio tubiashii]